MLSYDFVKNQYNKLLKNFNIKGDYVFERASAEFQDKVVYSDYIRFSHPSYSEALPFILLDENGIPTKINTEIFSKMLIRLSDIDRNIWIPGGLSKILSENFDKLPEKVRNELLIKLADKEGSDIGSIIVNNFDKLPRNVQNLLFKIADNNKVMATLASIVSRNFDKLPDKIRYELLIKLADNNEKASYVADSLAKNFDKISENVRNLLFKILPENIRNQM